MFFRSRRFKNDEEHLLDSKHSLEELRYEFRVLRLEKKFPKMRSPRGSVKILRVSAGGRDSIQIVKETRSSSGIIEVREAVGIRGR